jgi:serine/threonine protein kinase
MLRREPWCFQRQTGEVRCQILKPMAILSESMNIRDTYEVERFLGEGAFAEVYRVKHRFLGRQAMKVFKAAGMTFEDIEEALGEAIMLSRIGHPNIVRVFDANTVETPRGLFGYFTMENVAGGSLDKFWQSHGTEFVPVTTTMEIMKQVCRGLSLAHRESPPVIHRDIKPQNILVGYEADGLRARVSDFGLAKRVNPLTLLATAAGTITFKPPETFTESKGDSCAADVWALGTTLYLLLTDQLPYEIPTDLAWGSNKPFQKLFRPASELNAEANEGLDEIIRKALRLKPSERFQNAMEMLDALEAWKPGIPQIRKKAVSADFSKAALGAEHSSPNQSNAEELANKALEMKRCGRLADAADLMEEAFNKWPDLRHKFAPQVRLWRCGISM